MAVSFFACTGLTGGTAGDLDVIDGTKLQDGAMAIVVNSSHIYFYRLNATSGAVENVPNVIAPNTNPGDKRWELGTVTQSQDIAIAPTFEGLTVNQDAKVKGSLEVLLNLTLGGQLDVSAATTIAGALTVNNDINATGNVDADGFTINGTPVGTSTDTYWNADADGNIYYQSGSILGNPISLNKATVDQNWTLPSGYNGLSVGPIQVDASVTLDGVWEII